MEVILKGLPNPHELRQLMPTRTNVVNTNVRVRVSRDAEVAEEHMDTSIRRQEGV